MVDNRLQVVVLDDYQGVAAKMAPWERSRVPLDVHSVRSHISDPHALCQQLVDADVIVAMRERTPLSLELLSQLDKLKLIVTTGMRNDSIQPPDGVMFCGTRILGTPTPELTWALILAAQRNLVSEAQLLRSGTWQGTIGEGLAGQTLGILGLGNVGQQVARVARAFGMHVIAWSQNLQDQAARDLGVARVERDELFALSDVLTIHTRLSERTRGVVNDDLLRQMKTGALLVNTSRGAIIEEAALVRALDEGRIRAALDVYDVEPLAEDSPLRDVPGVLLSPHLGYVVRQNYELFFADALECIEQFALGTPVRSIA